jgi:hypothetical protein
MDWFDVSFDEVEGKIRLSFDQDRYVRLLSRAEAKALATEVARVTEVARLAEVNRSIGLVPGADQL